MMACTLPFSITRSRPSRIFLPSTSTCRFLISNSGIIVSRCAQAFPPASSSPGGPVAFRRNPAGSASSAVLPHAALEADRNELLPLDREFHRQLLQHVLDESVDHQRHRLLGGKPALHAVEQRLFGDFRGRRLVLEHGGGILRLD